MPQAGICTQASAPVVCAGGDRVVGAKLGLEPKLWIFSLVFFPPD